MSEKLPGDQSGMVDSYQEGCGKALALIVVAAITVLIVAIVVWALFQIGEDIRESL